MSSWFNVDALKNLAEQVAEQAHTAVTKLEMPNAEMLEKLTLTSPELKAERERIDREERRKEEVKDMLAGMYPWETRDPDRDILVEECKEAILKLSEKKDTFFGPFEMPRLNVKLKDEKEDGDEEEHDGQDGEKDEEEEEHSHNKARSPSAESLERLKTLEPLPPLLQDFDLDSHVGLIKKMLQVDPKLVKMQAQLSGGGAHEKTFFHNYFFHVAWCRYEAGLSIDEIWSDQPLQATVKPQAAGAAEDDNEETITFETHDNEEEKAFPAEPTTDSDAPFRKEKDGERKNTSDSADFELVNESNSDEAAGEDDLGEAVDYELDELEAEIARELED